MSANNTNRDPIKVEKTFDVRPNEVWEAITDKDKMRKWYFDIKEFRPVVGLEFEFYAGDDKRKYRHLCKIKEVVQGKKISYSWKYDYDPGISVVTFELFPDGDKTRLRLTHAGIENFSNDHPELAKENFVQGWNEIVNSALKKYLEGRAALHHDHG